MKTKWLLFFTLFYSFSVQADQGLLQFIPDPSSEYADEIVQLSGKSGAAGDFFSLKLAEQKLISSENTEAVKIAQTVKTPALVLWKNIILAMVFVSDGKNDEALRLLQNKPEDPSPDLSYGQEFYASLVKRFYAIRYLALKNKGGNASDEATQLVSFFPNDSNVVEFLGSDASLSLTSEQKIKKLHRLHFGYKWKDVDGLISAAEIVTSSVPHEKKCTALYHLGNSLRNVSGRADGARDAFREILKKGCDSNTEARALYWLGVLSGGDDTSGESREALLKLATKFPQHRLADDALYKLYKRAQKSNDVAGMKEYRRKLFSLERGDMRDEFVFDEGFPFYEKGDYAKAVEIFSQVENKKASPDESHPRVLYWLARSLEKSGKKHDARAKSIYQKLVDNNPFSFYAVLAARRLNTSIKIPHLPSLNKVLPGDSEGYSELVNALNRAGYHDAAGEALDLLVHHHPDWVENDPESLASTLMESHNYRAALQIAADRLETGVYGPVEASNSPFMAALYPRAFVRELKEGYKMNSLPPGAIEGIMREESLFQRNARSWVGATGLMQLMPATAAMLVRQNPQIGSGKLTEPRHNILLGSTYLKDMRDYFGGQLPLAIMAYNAGPGNVNRWLRSNGGQELDEFIENIPLSETRGYVKRVMRSMHVYGFFYGSSYFKKPSFDFTIRSKVKK